VKEGTGNSARMLVAVS